MLVPAFVFGIMLTLMLSAGSVVADSGNTKIAPTEAAPPHPFTIIDTPYARLVDGSVAVFKLNGAETIIPLNTHKPYKTAQGVIPEGMGGGTYDVYVRMPDGTEFFVGTFTVDAPVITPAVPTISPTFGAPGSAFTITDPDGRIGPSDLAIFYSEGSDPAGGTPATNVIVGADGATLTGGVPGTCAPQTQYYVTVRPAFDQPARFNDLAFLVTA